MFIKFLIFLLYLSYTNQITYKLQENELKRIEQINLLSEIKKKPSIKLYFHRIIITLKGIYMEKINSLSEIKKNPQ